MSSSIHDLLRNYARLGLRHWANESLSVKRRARGIDIKIATNQAEADRAVLSPFRPAAMNGRKMVLIPMPCRQNRVYAAFFAPWISGTQQGELSFDLVVLLQQGPPFAFRFEPTSRYSNSAHGYDHVQLNQKLGREMVPIAGSLSQLPTTYPAFPVPSNDPTTRFLAMAVAMHGYPKGVDDILRDAFDGKPRKMHKAFLDMTTTMMA